MSHQNIGVRILAIFLTTIVLFTGATVVLSNNAKAWDADVWVSPTRVTTGDVVNFKIKIENMGSHPMKITWIGIHFDWMDEGYYYASNDVSEDYPYILGSGEIVIFHINGVPIPNEITTNTHHSATLRIYAADPGIISEWGYPYYNDYSGSVFVEEPTYRVSGYVVDANTGAPIWGAVVSIGSYTDTTDYNGHYSIDGIKEGTYTVTVEADGYQTSSKTVTVNHNIEVNFNLNPILSDGGGNNGGDDSWWRVSTITEGVVMIVFICGVVIIAALIIYYYFHSKEREKNSGSTQPPLTTEMQQKTEIGSNTKFCPYCGREIPADAKICPYCGHTLE